MPPSVGDVVDEAQASSAGHVMLGVGRGRQGRVVVADSDGRRVVVDRDEDEQDVLGMATALVTCSEIINTASSMLVVERPSRVLPRRLRAAATLLSSTGKTVAGMWDVAHHN
jgi:hypothetical protein